jgi:DNA-directed RNA polymerase subunit RPC12/RpoP
VDPTQSLAPRTPRRCARCEALLELEDLRCPLCGLAAPGVAAELPAGDRLTAAVARCSACRASIAYSADDRTPRCAYCGSEAAVDVPEDPPEQAGAFAPFRVRPEEARASLRRHLLGLGFFRPKDLASASRLEALQPIWWPAWVVDATADVSWTADSDAGAERAEWAPHAGQSRLVLRNCTIPASRGLSERECRALVPFYDLSQALSGAPAEPAGAQVEQFGLRRSGARAQIVGAVQAEAESTVAATLVPGSRRRNVRVAVMLSGLKTERYALPAYVLAYRYGRRLYRAVVHGQDGARVLATAPYSWKKIAFAALLALAAAAGLVALIAAVASGRQPPGI